MGISELRPLKPEELELVSWLISHGTPEAQNYQSQIEQLQVVGHCSCGPTVDFYARKAPVEFLADLRHAEAVPFYEAPGWVLFCESSAVVVQPSLPGRVWDFQLFPGAGSAGLFSGAPPGQALKRGW